MTDDITTSNWTPPTADEIRESLRQARSFLLERQQPILPQRLFVTPAYYSSMRQDFESFRMATIGGPASFYGIQIEVTTLPLKKQIPRSLDRFAEYEPKDMEWAVPAGLAEWQEIDVDAMLMQQPERVIGQLLIGP